MMLQRGVGTIPTTWDQLQAGLAAHDGDAINAGVAADIRAAQEIYIPYLNALLARTDLTAVQRQYVQGKLDNLTNNAIPLWGRIEGSLPNTPWPAITSAVAHMQLPADPNGLIDMVSAQMPALTAAQVAINQQVENQYTQQQQAIIAAGNQTVDYSTIPAQYRPQNIVAQPGSVTALNNPSYTGYTAPQIAAGVTSGAPGGITSFAPPAAGAANQGSVPGTVPTWVWLAGGGAVALMLFMGGGGRR